ncbi:DNA-binding response regulator, OmpR family, contains REC and winged-helix (wHTH) domain [Rubritalea squalenifaciens DSM 18772]|uniref:DNA-binding response regulator, OmpR family, contains REC and winged-helix (WHTH) domain n=1 Tax=Rubritalea squalenifaciens DSM 18772 TaxID=1123071 RepID=A0A1M6DNY8_9BACT|nr:response regulator transcription factor [Rubritalea squalenifaciens]SHI74873.1 DNA-binding response regulator, OmpR family, contains REC and winged-helix (wHTH) domain [Rubritalea squalenifaciens DSM 18772]
MRILLVEDSKHLRNYLSMALKNQGYAVDCAADGEDGLWYIESHRYDVILLDIMMPKIDGLEVLRRIRKADDDTHVLLLTAKDAVSDKVAGLRAGADDYLIKPFDLEELMARVEALARRACGKKSPVIRIGELEMDLTAKKVSVHGQELHLTGREYLVLEYLLRRRGEVVTRSEIEENVYDENADLMSNVVNSTISLLRKKLQEGGAGQMIQTRRGLGYCIE